MTTHAEAAEMSAVGDLDASTAEAENINVVCGSPLPLIQPQKVSPKGLIEKLLMVVANKATTTTTTNTTIDVNQVRRIVTISFYYLSNMLY